MKTDIDSCIKCSICNASCPVARATGLFPGPKFSGPDAERFRIQRKTVPPAWLELCDFCKICETVCPHDIPIADLQIRSRMAERKKGKLSFRNRLLGHSYRLGKLGSWTAPISNRLLGAAFFRWLLDRGLAIDGRMKLPAYRRRTFRKWFRSRPAVSGEPVAYFFGCYTDTIDPDLGRAVVEVLEKNGFRVTLPRQECCGLPLIGNGLFKPAAELAERNIRSLRREAEEGRKVVFSSPSCGMTLSREYENVLDLDGASLVAENLFDISQFLLQLHDTGRLKTDFREMKETVYYHVPCHLRALQIGLPALDLLSLIPGLKVVELPDACCGLAGTFGFKKEKYALAAEVGQELFRAIRKVKATTVISDCEACRMQIRQNTGVETRHPIQVLRQAYGD